MALTTFQLEGEADQWWRSIKSIWPMKDWTWGEFEIFFIKKYSPTLTQEFYGSTHNDMTVASYVNHFEALSRETHEGNMNEEHKA